MTINEYLNSVIYGDTNHKSFELLTRCVEALEKSGHAPNGINHFGDSGNKGDLTIWAEEVYCHNGTGSNVSVALEVWEKVGNYTSQIRFKVKVPKDASDKVIANRVAKLLEYLG